MLSMKWRAIRAGEDGSLEALGGRLANRRVSATSWADVFGSLSRVRLCSVDHRSSMPPLRRVFARGFAAEETRRERDIECDRPREHCECDYLLGVLRPIGRWIRQRASKVCGTCGQSDAGSKAVPWHFGHDSQAAAVTGRVKCLVWPQAEHFHLGALSSSRRAISSRAPSAACLMVKSRRLSRVNAGMSSSFTGFRLRFAHQPEGELDGDREGSEDHPEWEFERGDAGVGDEQQRDRAVNERRSHDGQSARAGVRGSGRISASFPEASKIRISPSRSRPSWTA